jgi:hypothetical protein
MITALSASNLMVRIHARRNLAIAMLTFSASLIENPELSPFPVLRQARHPILGIPRLDLDNVDVQSSVETETPHCHFRMIELVMGEWCPHSFPAISG